jgi:hypothetical protein
MTEQHILNELYRAQADLEKAQALVHAYQDVIFAARRMLRHIDAQTKVHGSSGGPYGLAADNLRLSLAFIHNPNGDAE